MGMALPTIRRKPSKSRRAVSTVNKAGSALVKLVKARIAWLAAKKVAKVAGPAVAAGTVAVVATTRRDHKHDGCGKTMHAVDDVPPAAAGVA
jgi:hypothetical protein